MCTCTHFITGGYVNENMTEKKLYVMPGGFKEPDKNSSEDFISARDKDNLFEVQHASWLHGRFDYL